MSASDLVLSSLLVLSVWRNITVWSVNRLSMKEKNEFKNTIAALKAEVTQLKAENAKLKTKNTKLDTQISRLRHLKVPMF